MRGEWAKVHLKGKKKLRAAVDIELKENIEIGIETEIEEKAKRTNMKKLTIETSSSVR